jgi:ABC-type uncharacterized transport system ATPase subunit
VLFRSSWFGRPVIQLPEDIVRIQEVLYRVKPDVVIETGVAHGGSLVMYASFFKAMGRGRVIGVDIEIRRTMWDFLRELNASGTTIILTTHYLEEAETLCRNIAIIDRGRIAESDRMDRLLLKLHTESFVFSLRAPVAVAPQLAGYDISRLDDHTLEVEVSKDRDLNELFARLSADGIHVISMRNKVNRLEEIFMRLVDKSGAA